MEASRVSLVAGSNAGCFGPARGLIGPRSRQSSRGSGGGPMAGGPAIAQAVLDIGISRAESACKGAARAVAGGGGGCRRAGRGRWVLARGAGPAGVGARGGAGGGGRGRGVWGGGGGRVGVGARGGAGGCWRGAGAGREPCAGETTSTFHASVAGGAVGR